MFDLDQKWLFNLISAPYRLTSRVETYERPKKFRYLGIYFGFFHFDIGPKQLLEIQINKISGEKWDFIGPFICSYGEHQPRRIWIRNWIKRNLKSMIPINRWVYIIILYGLYRGSYIRVCHSVIAWTRTFLHKIVKFSSFENIRSPNFGPLRSIMSHNLWRIITKNACYYLWRMI